MAAGHGVDPATEGLPPASVGRTEDAPIAHGLAYGRDGERSEAEEGERECDGLGAVVSARHDVGGHDGDDGATGLASIASRGDEQDSRSCVGGVWASKLPRPESVSMKCERASYRP